MQQSLALTDLQTAAGAALAVAIIIQLVKPFLAEDRDVRLAAMAAGMLVSVGATLTLGQHGAGDLGNAILAGFLGGASAIGIYQLQKPVGLLAPKSGADELSNLAATIVPTILASLTAPEAVAAFSKLNGQLAPPVPKSDAAPPTGTTDAATAASSPGS